MKFRTLLLVLILVFSLLPLGVLAAGGSILLHSFSDSMAQERVGFSGYSHEIALNTYFSEYQRFNAQLASTDIVIKATQGMLSNVEKDLDKMIKSRMELDSDVLDILILSQEGSIIKDTMGRQRGSTFFGYIDELEYRSKRETYISPVFIPQGGTSALSTVDTIEITVPFFYTARQIRSGENTVGYLIELISVEGLLDLISPESTIEDGFSLIADPKGTLLNGSDRTVTRIEELGQFRQPIRTLIENPISNTERYKRANIKGYIGSYCSIGSTGWIWLNLYPKTAADAFIWPSVSKLLLFLCVIATLCFALLLYQFITCIRPLPALLALIDKPIEPGHQELPQSKRHGKNEFISMSTDYHRLWENTSIGVELYRTVCEISDNMLFEWDYVRQRMFVSDNLLEKFNIDPATSTLTSGFVSSLMDGPNQARYLKDLKKLTDDKVELNSEYRIMNKKGKTIWISLRAQCVYDRMGNPLRLVGVINDIDREKKLTQRLSERASYDFLSQLYNRSTFERELQSELDRHINRRLAIMFIDVDDFKQVNDQFGHSVGDDVIRFISSVIKESVGPGGFAGRFGGDEFVLCITDAASLNNNAQDVGMNILNRLKQGFYSEAAKTQISVKTSIGISLSPQHGTTSRELIAAADAAMYRVKKHGKTHYHVYSVETDRGL
jgi:diguanylate cyclase (GGDEF)-like protein/PAS domain S-box-containing protein